MPDTRIFNIDLTTERFNALADAVRAELAAAAVDTERTSLAFLLTERGTDLPDFERQMQTRQIRTRVARVLAEAGDDAQLVILECVDQSQRRVLPDLEKLQTILGAAAETLGDNAGCVTMAARYGWDQDTAFSGGSLSLFAVLPLHDVYAPEEIMEFFNDIADEAGVELSPMNLLGLSEETDAVLSTVLSETVAQVGVDAETADEITSVIAGTS